VLYEKEYAALLPGLLKQLMSDAGHSLVADPGRVAAPLFIESCRAAGLAIVARETQPFAAGEIRQSIDIYEIQRC
nr:hypothetical protein [Gemmatimonadaceae bacterium]